MGFGLLALGYIFLNFYTTGADLIGYVIMLIALFKLKKIVPGFKMCIVSVILLIPVGMFNLLGFADTAFELGLLKTDYTSAYESTDTVDSSSDGETSEGSADDATRTTDEMMENVSERTKGGKIAEAIFNAVFIFGSLCFHYFFYKNIHNLCIQTGSLKLAAKANRNMIINIVFFSVWGFLTAGGANVAAITAVTLLHFVVLILNFIYIHSCYATFAFEGEEGTEAIED